MDDPFGSICCGCRNRYSHGCSRGIDSCHFEARGWFYNQRSACDISPGSQHDGQCGNNQNDADYNGEGIYCAGETDIPTQFTGKCGGDGWNRT